MFLKSFAVDYIRKNIDQAKLSEQKYSSNNFKKSLSKNYNFGTFCNTNYKTYDITKNVRHNKYNSLAEL